MIRIGSCTPPLLSAEQYGLDLLADLSGLLIVSDTGAAASASESPEPVLIRVAPPPGGSRGRSSGAGGPADLERALDVGDGLVTLDRSLLRAVTSIAGAGSEQRSLESDRHQRVPSSANPVVAADRARVPIVSQAAQRVRQAVARAAGRRPVRCIAPWPDGHRWAAAFTHDVDVVAGWPLFAGLRLLELAGKGEVRSAARVLGAAARHAVDDPVWRGVQDVLETERRAAVTSTWFVLCGTPSLTTLRAGDLTYRPESARSRRILDAVRRAGHEIGLHGSFATSTVPGTFDLQRGRLAALAARSVGGVRQHYLRMRPGATQQHMAGAGFTYDATYGFPDRNGFRLGVADVVPGWDETGQRVVALDEVPLIWMDRAQSKYQGIEDPARWVDDALELAAAARAVDGLWVGLWHPNLTPALGYPGAPPAYRRLVDGVMAERPYVASLEGLVAWRGLRRSVRGRLTANGQVTPVGPATRDFDVVIEDADGRAVARLPRSG